MVCMVTLLVEMRPGEWPSNHSTWVGIDTSSLRSFAKRPICYTEMLTPVDQPLDKLDDLQKDEMYVGFLYNALVSDRLHIYFSENMRG